MAELEYKESRTGIAKFDDLLFKIRAWNISFSGVVFGAFIGLKSYTQKSGSEKVVTFVIEPVAAMVFGTVVICLFWFLDAYNKSHQVILIDRSRKCEDFLRKADNKYDGPLVSESFRKANSQSGVWGLSPANNIMEASVWVFYLPMILILNISISTSTLFAYDCLNKECRPDTSIWITLGFLICLIGTLAFLFKQINADYNEKRENKEGRLNGPTQVL